MTSNQTPEREQFVEEIREKISEGLEQLDNGGRLDVEQVFCELEAELDRRQAP